MYKKLTILAILLASACTSVTNYSEKEITLAVSEKRYTAVVDMVLPNTDIARPTSLLLASNTMLKQDRDSNLENAAFLFYVGLLRARNDLEYFPPYLTGGNKPGVALGAMIFSLQRYIAKTLPQHPKEYIRVVERLNDWHGKYPKTYAPSWEGKATVSREELESKLQKGKSELLFLMDNISTLLKNPDYAELVKALHQNPTAKERKNISKTMEEIETGVGVDGFIAMQANRKTHSKENQP